MLLLFLNPKSLQTIALYYMCFKSYVNYKGFSLYHKLFVPYYEARRIEEVEALLGPYYTGTYQIRPIAVAKTTLSRGGA